MVIIVNCFFFYCLSQPEPHSCVVYFIHPTIKKPISMLSFFLDLETLLYFKILVMTIHYFPIQQHLSWVNSMQLVSSGRQKLCSAFLHPHHYKTEFLSSMKANEKFCPFSMGWMLSSVTPILCCLTRLSRWTLLFSKKKCTKWSFKFLKKLTTQSTSPAWLQIYHSSNTASSALQLYTH